MLNRYSALTNRRIPAFYTERVIGQPGAAGDDRPPVRVSATVASP